MKNIPQIYDIVIIGNYTKDTIISPSGTRMIDGGGFNYGAYVVAMMRLRTATVTRLAKEDSHVLTALQRLGVDVFPVFTPQSTHMRIYYPTTNIDERVLSVTCTAGAFTPDQIRNLYARVFLINASTRDEVSIEILKEIKKKNTLLTADVQGFVRIVAPDGTLVNDAWFEKQQVLPLIDILKTDAIEAEILTGEKDVKVAARKLAALGPKEIVLTHSKGLLVYANSKLFEAKFYPKKVVGRSGRGDTCIAAYTAKRLTAPPEAATIWAAAVTSLKMEAEGPIVRERSEVDDLINKMY